MTKQEVHEELCKMPEEQKRLLAFSCQLNGVNIEDLEETLAKILTEFQKSMQPAMKTLQYLEGGA